MGTISDLKELVQMGPKLAQSLDKSGLNTKSIARGAKDATLQFPCLISNTCPINMANTIARTLEHVYASFTQQLLSMNSMFDITIDPTPMSYLKKLHQNTKFEFVEELTVPEDEITDYMERVYDGTYRLYLNPEKDFGILFNESLLYSKELSDSNLKLMNEYLSEFNLTPFGTVTEADSDDTNSLNYELNKEKFKYQKGRDAVRDSRDLQRSFTKDNMAPRLLDRDVKKSNDMVPYAIQVRLIAVNDKKEFVQYVDFIVGVKAILHPIPSAELMDNIVKSLKNDDTMFKLLKWTSGEISLLKDVLLNINDIKDAAVERQKGKSPFFPTLKRLKKKKLQARNFTVPTKILPNATIVVTSNEVEYLDKNFGINLYREIIAKKLMDRLYLMTFVIYDEGSDTVSILYDGDSRYQTYSLDSLKRDNDLHSNRLTDELKRMISR